MHLFWSRSSRAVAVCGILLVAHALNAIAQAPPQEQPSPALPSKSEIVSPDDPIMQALRERALIAPAPASSPSETHPQPVRKSADRWRVAERLLREARRIERDADSLEQLGHTDIAETLRQVAATTREQVVRILKVAEKPMEHRDSNRPLTPILP